MKSFVNHLKKYSKLKNDGFTLIEVLIAIFIGLIVMGMAVAILGVTNSTSLRVLAKSEAQQNTRNSLVKILDSVTNAESLDVCKVGTDKLSQEAIQTAPDRFRPGISVTKCKEVGPSGYVIAWAQPNRMCYYDKQETGDPAKIFCLTRGGTAAESSPYSITLTDPFTNTNLSGCVNHSIAGSSKDILYFYTCDPSGGSQINWPSSYGYSSTGPEYTIADLGSNVATTSTTVPPIASSNIFEYILDSTPSSAKTTPKPLSAGYLGVDHPDITKIVALKVAVNVAYKTNKANNTDVYKFYQTILLRGSNKALEESYNGQ